MKKESGSWILECGITCQPWFVSEVGDRFAFSSERFAPSIVPNSKDSVPDVARRALSIDVCIDTTKKKIDTKSSPKSL